VPSRHTDEAGQDRRDVGERVRRRRIVGRLELPASETASHAGADGGEGLRHVLIAWRGCGVKGEAARAGVAENTVEYERVQVDVELEAAPETLDHRHRHGL